MFLDQFEAYRSICIQCHDGPDADAIGAGYGLYSYFHSLGREVHLIYAGERVITKPSLLLMLEQLDIPIEYVTDTAGFPRYDILITVDCQYQGGNITPLSAAAIGMIDHHPVCVDVDEKCYIAPENGSCCTVVWKLLEEAGFDVNADVRVSTALYYGLYSDTGQLSEIYHSLDRRMRDSLLLDRAKLERMIHSNLLREELQIAGEALTNYYYDEEMRFALMPTKPCDPNLLGVISDMVNHVASIDYCVVYNETPIGYRMSVRSTRSELPASVLVEYLSRGIGSGGGHLQKAGGTLMKKLLAKHHPGEAVETVLRGRMQQCITEASC